MKNTIKNISHEDIYIFVAGYSIEHIIDIELQDPQFIAISSMTEKAKIAKGAEKAKLLLIDLVVKISLISYQIGGTGEQRWTEVLDYIYHKWSDLLETPDLINQEDRRKKLLQTCKYNRRLINMKISRLSKIGNLRDIFPDLNSYQEWYDDMNIFYTKLRNKLWADIYAKTPLFAAKMFGYIGRIIFSSNEVNELEVFWSKQIYPANLSIPLDSRLKQIYIAIHWPLDPKNPKHKNEYIIWYFDKLWNDHNISPLHLDSLLWLKYRDEINI